MAWSSSGVVYEWGGGSEVKEVVKLGSVTSIEIGLNFYAAICNGKVSIWGAL
jgi:hypothetical protein